MVSMVKIVPQQPDETTAKDAAAGVWYVGSDVRVTWQGSERYDHDERLIGWTDDVSEVCTVLAHRIRTNTWGGRDQRFVVVSQPGEYGPFQYVEVDASEDGTSLSSYATYLTKP